MPSPDRRSLLKALGALPFAPLLSWGTADEKLDLHIVRAGDDRTGQHHKGPRPESHLDYKVLTSETNGGLFVLEHMNMTRGGPPRHLHYDQEEWFFLIEGGEVAMEIGEQKLRLKPGDSVLAPRNVPHVWAYLSEQPGRMFLGFTPAGKMEDFFNETSKPGVKPGDAKLLEAHGMKLVGPPLLGS